MNALHASKSCPSAGALVIGENAIEPGYLDDVHNPQNGYFSLGMPFDAGRGNEFAVVTR